MLKNIMNILDSNYITLTTFSSCDFCAFLCSVQDLDVIGINQNIQQPKAVRAKLVFTVLV